MGKSVKERLDETIKRDKQEIAEEDNKMEIKGNKETNVEDFMNKKIKEMMDDGEQKLEDDDEDDAGVRRVCVRSGDVRGDAGVERRIRPERRRRGAGAGRAAGRKDCCRR